MTTSRFLLECLVMGLIGAVAVVALNAAFGWPTQWILCGYIALAVPVMGALRNRRVLPRAIWPDPSERHKPLALVAVAGWLFAGGGALSVHTGGGWQILGYVLFFGGLLGAIPGVVALIRHDQAARHDPRQNDERSAALDARAMRWSWTVMLNVALLGGLADYLGILALSAAQVGFAAGAIGILTQVSAQAWLDWRDGQGAA